MKGFIINVVGKYLGINKALEWADGKGTYLVGGGLMLAGVAEVLIGLAPVLAAKDPAALVDFGQSLAASPGVHKFLEGLGLIRLRMAVAKPAAEAAK